jgi:predicted Zn finger-like uncharacterized protein
MKVTCQACSAQYTIADDKVKGRKVKIRCKACQTPIVVDGQNPPAEAIGSGQSEAPPALDPFAPETALPSEADVWNVNLSDSDSRTMTTAEVIEGFRTGLVTTDAYVWKDGMGDWLPIMDCVELAPLLQGPTAPPAPVAGQTPLAPAVAPAAKVGGVPNLAGASTATGSGARAASAKQSSGADLFGDLDSAGSEGEDVDVGASAQRNLPVLPGSTAYDDKPTGARNENSVLFSLDAMKAGFVGGAPSSASEKNKPSAPRAAPRSTQPSNPDDPFGMGGSAGFGGVGGLSLNANQALLTAPAPPEPKPVAVPAFSPMGAPATAGGMDDKTKKLVMFGGIGAGAVILLLLGILVFGGKSKSEEEASAEAAASASAAAATKAVEEKKAEEKKEEPKAEEKKEEPAPVASAAPSAEEKKEEPKADAAKAGTHSTTPAATKKEEPAPAAASNAPPFSKASAIAALGSAASSAAGCKKAGGPTGTGKVQVTFAPSGRVTTASVMGAPFAGTAVGGCVAGRFRGAKVPAFSGSPVTVSKSFAIN